VKRSGPIRALIYILSAISLFFVWYAIAADYDYGMVAGTYEFSGHGESSTLVLNKDRSFLQKRIHDGKVDYAKGTWHRSGEGGVDFSEDFLEVGGASHASDGQTYGEVIKHFLILVPSIVLGNDWDSGPRFNRAFFNSGKLR